MRKIPVYTGFPSALHRDMARKFLDDLKALVDRSGPILDLAVGQNYAENIILSSLAVGGVEICRELGAPRGTFQAMVIAVEDYKDKKAE
jgi:hypothetical protein